MGLQDLANLIAFEKRFRAAPWRTADAKVVGHWHVPRHDFATSSLAYYDAVEAELIRRQLPEMKISRVVWRERGMISASRIYLRVEWRDYICDMCAAPLGTGFFFSSWLVQLPRRLTLWNWLGIGTSLALFYLFLFVVEVGVIKLAGFELVGLGFLLWLVWSQRLLVRIEIEDFLLGMTYWGALWDRFLRLRTFYEDDTAEMLEESVRDSMLTVIDGLSVTEMLAPLSAEERKPVMRDYFKKRL